MERFEPKNHVSFAEAREFERSHLVTVKLGLSYAEFGDLTSLYLAEYTLSQELARLQREFRSPGRECIQKGLPKRVFRWWYRESLKEKVEASEARDYALDTIMENFHKLPTEDRPFANRLRGTVTDMFAKGIIQHQRYELFTTRENKARIAMYRIQ